ncbi:unnamed protein product, partial [Ixodes hexagonus]
EVERDSGFLGFLRSLPEATKPLTPFNFSFQKPATTFRFFDRNEYYTVHSSDAEYVCREVFRTMSVLKYLGSGDKKIGSVCLSKRNFEALLVELLLVKRYRIEVYQNTSSKGNAWGLTTKASPGNLSQVEDILFGGSTHMSEAKGVMAVSIKFNGKQQTVGIAYGDAVLQRLTVAEFDDDEHFSNLCTVLVHLSPQECLISPPDVKKFAEVKGIVERSGVLVTECKPADFLSKDVVQDLGRLLIPSSLPQGQAAMLPEVDLKVAMESLAGVIKFLNLTADSENFGCFQVSTFDFSQYVRINSAAIRALGVLPGSEDQKAELSLLKVLNRCRTPGGQRLLAQWLKQPLMDVQKIEERLEMVELFVQKGELRHCLHEDYLRHFPDLLRVAKRLQRHKSTLQDLYKTYQMLQVLPKVREALAKGADEDKEAVLQGLFAKPLAELESDFSKYLEMVETTLDMEAAEGGDFLVKPDFDDDLKALREELDSLEGKCRGYLDKAARDLGLESGKSIKLESSKDLGFHFRITRKEEPALRSRKGYLVIDTKQNGVRFRSPDLLSTNAGYLDTRKAYEEAQQSITKMIVEIAGGYAEPMHQLSEVISHLDVLVGLAVAAASASKPYVRPKVLPKGSGTLKMTGLRHACVESQDNVMFIPNDVEMKKGKQTPSCYIITGPNMGGKSTYIRSVALAVLMAQVGSFVPCDSAELSLVDAILTRIGAGDQQMKGVSTFMAEMLESAHILRNATADSLVVIDELGRGTSTYDGFGLAWAISEHLSRETDAFCLFATHFHELTELADELPCVRNVHVTADVREDSFTLLYKVKPGVCNKSFGVEVAELAHFPEHVIKVGRGLYAVY